MENIKKSKKYIKVLEWEFLYGNQLDICWFYLTARVKELTEEERQVMDEH